MAEKRLTVVKRDNRHISLFTPYRDFFSASDPKGRKIRVKLKQIGKEIIKQGGQSVGIAIAPPLRPRDGFIIS